MSNLAEVPQLAARSAIADTAKVPQEPEHLEMLDAKLPAEAATDAVAPVSAFAHCSKREILRKFWRLVLTGFAVSLGAMYVGYGLAVTGSIIANPGFIAQFGTIDTPEGPVLDAYHIAMWGGLFFVAQTVGQAASPFIADNFGRKVSMYLLNLSLLIAIILEIVARDWKVFLAAKIMSGCAAALTGASIMTYLSEIALPQIRGGLLGVFSLMFAIGQLGIAIGLQVIFRTNPMAYRNAFYSQFVVFGLFLAVVLYIPESPAWLCSKGRHEQAQKALRRIVGQVEGYLIEHEYSVIRHEFELSVTAARTQASSDWSALFKWVNFKRCIAATLPFSYQNFCGAPLVFGFSSYFFALAGLSDPFLGSMIISIILIVGVCLSFYTVEKIGRRTTVLVAGIALSIIDIAIGAASFAPSSSAFGSGLIALCSIWVFGYSLSFAPLGWTSLVEISSPNLRAKTAAVAMVIQSCSNILFSYIVPFMLDPQYAGWGTKIGFVFGGLSLLFWIPCYFLFPESKGRTYTELDILYASGIPVRHFGKEKLEASQATA